MFSGVEDYRREKEEREIWVKWIEREDSLNFLKGVKGPNWNMYFARENTQVRLKDKNMQV